VAQNGAHILKRFAKQDAKKKAEEDAAAFVCYYFSSMLIFLFLLSQKIFYLDIPLSMISMPCIQRIHHVCPLSSFHRKN
jgi:hypothetical protein